jgi:outer membrane receptor protein involved in Fe transport
VSGWTKFDAQAAYDFARFRVHGYVRNLFDKFYPTYLFSSTFATAGDPREVGIGLEVGF